MIGTTRALILNEGRVVLHQPYFEAECPAAWGAVQSFIVPVLPSDPVFGDGLTVVVQFPSSQVLRDAAAKLGLWAPD